MAKSENQKKKILYLLDYLRQNTDEEHKVTMEQILVALENKGIKAERKSIYSDLKALNEVGFEVASTKKSKNTYYYLLDREFDLSQVKILVDAVNSFKFVSDNNSKEIVSKLEKLVSRYQASTLNRQTYVADKVKSTNKTIFYNIELIYEAIRLDCQISFNYFSWNYKKEKEYRNKRYFVNPFRLILTDGNYYLVAVEGEKLKHYRVDKIENVEIVNIKRTGKEYYNEKNIEEYASGVFGMYGNEFTNVDLLFSNDLANVVIDRFGREIIVSRADKEHFKITVKVARTQQFFAWLCGLGSGAKILYPPEVKKKYLEHIRKIQDAYSEESSGD